MSDEFCNVFDQQIASMRKLQRSENLLKRDYHHDCRMSDSEMMTIMTAFHASGFLCLPQPEALLLACLRSDAPPVSRNGFVQSFCGVAESRSGCLRQDCADGQVNRHQFHRQHAASRMPQPAHTAAQDIQGAGTTRQMLHELVLRLQAPSDMQQ